MRSVTMVLTLIPLSGLMAAFTYHVVCRMENFPFVNVLSIVVLLALWADHVFSFKRVNYVSMDLVLVACCSCADTPFC